MRNKTFETIIGLEIHAQLKTESKLFCSCPAEFGEEPNQNVCPVCLGFPGTLPVLNQKAVDLAIKLALALNCRIAEKSRFARKHYFYPDLPKGYQITQYEEPLAYDGFLMIDNKKIRVRRIHLEEDSGKLIHTATETLIDFNRAGVPLVEIVTEPDLNSPEETVKFLSELRLILLYLDVSFADMEKGQLRCEPNVSLKFGYQSTSRREIKNLNSLKNVYDALKYESTHQKEMLNEGKEIIQQTLLWDEAVGKTFPMRLKEEAEDYRYFPEPDLPPLVISVLEIERIKETIKELPQARKERFIKEYRLNEKIAEIIIRDKDLADYYEKLLLMVEDKKLATNWVVNELLRVLNEKNCKISDFVIEVKDLAFLLNQISQKRIPLITAKKIFYEMVDKKLSPEVLLKKKEISADENLLDKVINEVLKKNRDAVEKYYKGKKGVLGFLIGEAMKGSEGKFDPKIIKEKLVEILDKKDF